MAASRRATPTQIKQQSVYMLVPATICIMCLRGIAMWSVWVVHVITVQCFMRQEIGGCVLAQLLSVIFVAMVLHHCSPSGLPKLRMIKYVHLCPDNWML